MEEAESLIGQAMLKRATATTNSNSQSSRSQCIINIRAASDGVSNETKVQSTDAMLTIVDLAGAEREKRTGNQGERLVESNFINNTSMVFGQCLRLYVLVVTFGVPEKPKERISETSSKFSVNKVLARLSRRKKEDGFDYNSQSRRRRLS